MTTGNIFGTLAERFLLFSALQFPLAVKNVLLSEAWREREWNGRVIRHKTFRSFIETSPVEGCGWTEEKVARLLNSDPDIERRFREAMINPFGSNQHTEGSRKSTSQKRDRAHQLSRLSRDAPALYDEVCAGNLSANAAAIQAGFRKKLTKFEQIVKWLPSLSDEERSQLKEML
jgi:hypothetical protein